MTDSRPKLVGWNYRGLELWSLTNEDIIDADWSQISTRMVKQLIDPFIFLAVIELLDKQPSLELYSLLYLESERVLAFHSHPLHLKVEVVGRVWRFREVKKF